MNYKYIDINKITIDKNLRILYKKNKLHIITPILYLPFGIDKSYNNIFLKMQLKKNYYKDDTYLKFTNFIKNLEQKFHELTTKEINSQLTENEKFGNVLITKVPNINGKINIDIMKNKHFELFSNINKKDFMVLELVFDKLWIYNQTMLTYKIKVKKINIM